MFVCVHVRAYENVGVGVGRVWRESACKCVCILEWVCGCGEYTCVSFSFVANLGYEPSVFYLQFFLPPRRVMSKKLLCSQKINMLKNMTVAEIRMLRWISDKTPRDRIRWKLEC